MTTHEANVGRGQHAEALRELSDCLEKGLMPMASKRAERIAALDFAIATLSTPTSANVQESGGRAEYVLALLIAAGYVTQAKVDEARKIALGFADGPLEPKAAVGELMDSWKRRMREASVQSVSSEYQKGRASAFEAVLDELTAALSMQDAGEAEPIGYVRQSVLDELAMYDGVGDVAIFREGWPDAIPLYTRPSGVPGRGVDAVGSAPVSALVSKAQKIVTAMWAAWYSSDGTSPFEPGDNLTDLLNQIGNTLLNVPEISAANDARIVTQLALSASAPSQGVDNHE